MKFNAFGRNIRAMREDKNMTQQGLAEYLDMSTTMISLWETKGSQPKSKKTIKALCDLFNVNEQDLFGYSDGYYAKTRGVIEHITPQSSDTYLPVAGVAPAGEPNIAIEQTGETLWCPPEFCREGNFFVRVHGDSMNKVLPDGSYALIDTSGEVMSGNIALVKVNGDEATIKRVKLMDGAVFLEPESSNPEHRRRVIDETNPDSPEVRLIGRVMYTQTRL